MANYGSLSNVKIGDLRFLVTLASRVQTPNIGTGVSESYANPFEVYAAINPIGLQTFIGSEQIDTPITHRIVIRFIDLLDMFDVVLREITDIDGSVRQEIYRIRRISEWEGRQRFTVIDAELEKRDVSDAVLQSGGTFSFGQTGTQLPPILSGGTSTSNFDQSHVAITGGSISTTDVSGATVIPLGGFAARTLAARSADFIWAPDFGPVVTWNATTDVGPCINAAIAVAASRGGATIMLPAGTFGLATTLNQNTSGVHIKGAGVGDSRDTVSPNSFLAITKLLWIGAPGATMLDVKPTGTRSLYSCDVEGVVFDAANLAGVCAKFTQVSQSTIKVGVSEPQMVGAWMTTMPAGFSDAPGNQSNDVWIYSRSTSSTYSPTGILLDGGVGSNWNTSYNRFHQLGAWYAKGDGIVFGNSDNNIIYDMGTYGNPGNSTGKPCVFANSAYTMPNGMTVNGRAYDSVVLHVGTSSVVTGYQSDATLVAGSNTGTAAIATISLVTSASTPSQNKVLTFNSTTGVATGLAITNNNWLSGVPPRSAISSFNSTTTTLNTGATTVIASGTTVNFSFGITIGAVTGVYTITAASSSTFNITAPAGGHSQTGIAISGGIITFTDVIIPMSGTPATGDTWTLTVPSPAANIRFEYIDKANSVPSPFFEYGAIGFYSTTRSPFHQSVGGAGGISILATNAANPSVTIGGVPGGGAPGAAAALVGGFGISATGFGAGAFSGHNGIASGTYSVVIGEGSVASGSISFATGEGTLADGNYSRSGGNGSTARTQIAADVWASGSFLTQGDAQIGSYVLRGSGASTTAIRLTADASTASATNTLVMPNTSKYILSHELLIVDATTGDYASWTLAAAGIRRGANAAATSISATNFPSWVIQSSSSPTAATWNAPTMTADTTLGGVNISWTPPSSNTDQFYLTDRIRSVEIVK